MHASPHAWILMKIKTPARARVIKSRSALSSKQFARGRARTRCKLLAYARTRARGRGDGDGAVPPPRRASSPAAPGRATLQDISLARRDLPGHDCRDPA